MNNQEAIEILMKRFNDCLVCVREYTKDERKKIKDKCENKAIGMSIKALEQVEKYKWHDLRKDKNDLPDESKVLCVVEYCGKRLYTLGFRKREWEAFDVEDCSIGNNVIAWKYIQPFKSEVE